MIFKHFTHLTVLTLLTSTLSFADTFGGEISLGAYTHTPAGTASYTLPENSTANIVDLEDTFGWSTASDITFKAYLEHPVPLVPNIKLAYSTYSQEGTGEAQAFSWGNIADFSGAVNSSLDLGILDATFYYEVLDSDVEIDIGLTARSLLGDLVVNPIANANTPLSVKKNTFGKESVTVSTILPMLYGKARFLIPNTDLAFQFEGNAISYDNSTMYDYELGLRYTFTMGLGLEAGYKVLHLDSSSWEEEGLIIDLDSDGFYASVIWDF